MAIRRAAGCTTVSTDLIMFGLALWATTLLGATPIYSQLRHVNDRAVPTETR
jgi:hypothetical protein